MPNVQLDDIATFKGAANFSIRGLGINSSIPSIDPTVGVFVDGMYMGVTSGVLLDMFDLESVEVLRGPQGLLFGRNVTGGAVVINTKDPGDAFAFSVKTRDRRPPRGGHRCELLRDGIGDWPRDGGSLSAAFNVHEHR